MLNQIKKYPNGLRVIVSNNPSVRSVACGFYVGVGSSFENSTNNGLSHFTEHMLFKGTEKLSPFEIASAFESFGGVVNAFTGKENTCYYFKTIDETLENCFLLLSDIFLNSTFMPDELDKERKVILEEINMVEDSPEDICYDLISKALFGDVDLGQTILGTIDNVKRFNGDNIREFMKKFYTANNIVVTFSGNITIDEAARLTEKYVLPYLPTSTIAKNSIVSVSSKGVYLKRIKDFEQSNIILSFPSEPVTSEKIPVQALMNIMLGGGMSSRLFQEIREKQGLAYSVYSMVSSYQSIGAYNIALNISVENTEKAVALVRSELNKFIESGAEEKEFAKAKLQLKSAYIFLQENVQSVMSTIGKTLLNENTIFDIDEKIAAINKISIDELNIFSKNLLNKKNVCAAYVGKNTDVDILSIIKG